MSVTPQWREPFPVKTLWLSQGVLILSVYVIASVCNSEVSVTAEWECYMSHALQQVFFLLFLTNPFKAFIYTYSVIFRNGCVTMEVNLFMHHPQAFQSFDVLNRKYGWAKNTPVTSTKVYDSIVSLSHSSVGARLVNECAPFVDNFLCLNKFSYIFPFTKVLISSSCGYNGYSSCGYIEHYKCSKGPRKQIHSMDILFL